jgi:phage RecT family recombinase
VSNLITVETAKNPGEALCLNFRSQLERALSYELISGILPVGNFISAVAEDVAAQPRLAEAFRRSPGTAMQCLLQAAQCKLLVGARYQKFYLVPRERKGVPEVTSIIGYKGLMEMALRHPRVHSITANLVYEGEPFEYLPGENKLHHVWRMDADRSDDQIVAAYARCVITEPNSTRAVTDSPIFEVMTRAEILSLRDRSEAYRYAENGNGGRPPRRDSPWHKDFARMVRKSVLRRMLAGGSVPMDMGMAGAIHRDDAQDAIRADDAQDAPTATHPSTRAAAVKKALGIKEAAPLVAPFDLVEEAVEAIRSARSTEELEALRSRWDHFQGTDASTIAAAYAERADRMGKP